MTTSTQTSHTHSVTPKGMLIDGKWVPAASGQSIAMIEQHYSKLTATMAAELLA